MAQSWTLFKRANKGFQILRAAAYSIITKSTSLKFFLGTYFKGGITLLTVGGTYVNEGLCCMLELWLFLCSLLSCSITTSALESPVLLLSCSSIITLNHHTNNNPQIFQPQNWLTQVLYGREMDRRQARLRYARVEYRGGNAEGI